ncbi:hypothetical protein [Devosia aurantiaca]|uniref:Uncharacterized protein n=1 Tax=Devosia aurantiaca TaxID=2714858 RepID=A0A6M1SMP9_9HYPH|nr:hypothetical protein [Devosia aurantiaca]NGP17964.1 hypothetical protein [Devosia aurantiaca]
MLFTTPLIAAAAPNTNAATMSAQRALAPDRITAPYPVDTDTAEFQDDHRRPSAADPAYEPANSEAPFFAAILSSDQAPAPQTPGEIYTRSHTDISELRLRDLEV